MRVSMDELAVFDLATKGWVGEDELLQEEMGTFGVKYQPQQNVGQLKPIASALAEQLQHNLIICAFDSVSYFCFQEACAAYARRVSPVTSTVPSTSMTAWTSIFRGSHPREHGVYGTVFYLEEEQETISFLRRKLADEKKEGVFPWLGKSAGETLFTELNASGYKCSFYGLGSDLTQLSFFNQIASGATVHDMPQGELMEFDLQAYSNYLVDVINEEVLTRRQSEEKFCSVAFMSCARYIARHGITAHLQESLRSFAAAMQLIKRDNDKLSIVAVSDHGMVPQQPILSLPLIHDEEILDLCRHRPGGAGRILFFYPKQEDFPKVWELLECKIGDTGQLFTRAAFIDKYYQGNTYQHSRIGDIVAVAKDRRFPSAGLNEAYEHGGLDADEMTSFISLF